MEAGDEGDGEEALRVHLSPQEEVSLQVVEAEVVFTGGGRREAFSARLQHQLVISFSQEHTLKIKTLN